MMSLDQMEGINLLNQVAFDVIDAKCSLWYNILTQHYCISHDCSYLIPALLFILELQMHP